jgi:hypothetical protein
MLFSGVFPLKVEMALHDRLLCLLAAFKQPLLQFISDLMAYWAVRRFTNLRSSIGCRLSRGGQEYTIAYQW